MSAVLLAAQRIQTDLAGFTGAAAYREVTGAATSATEAISALVHGESGQLGYLWDNALTVPVSTASPARDTPGPNGGAGHPDAAGQAVFGLPIGAPAAPAVTPAQSPPAAPGGPGVADQARTVLGQAQERVKGIFGG